MNNIVSFLDSVGSPLGEETIWAFRRPGPPREEVERVREAVELAGRLTGWSGVPSPRAPLDLPTAETALDEALQATADCLQGRGPRPADETARPGLLALLTHLRQSRTTLREAVLIHRSAAQAHMAQALHRLREVSTVEELIERAPQEINTLGFDRGLVSRIVHSRWVTETCYVEKDPEFAAVIVAAGRADPVRLEDRLLEAEMARTGQPLLVNDPQNSQRVHHSLRKATETHAYVAAPIFCDGTAFGFAHADGFRDPRNLDSFDRDSLAIFAEGLGLALDRTLLAERLVTLQSKIDQYSGLVADLVDRFAEFDLQRQSRWARHQTPQPPPSQIPPR